MRRLFPLLFLVAGALVTAGCQEDDERLADIIQRFLLAGQGETPAKVERFVGRLPEGLPLKPPRYPGAEILTSTRLRPAPGTSDPATGEPLQGAVFFILLDTDDQREQVYQFYEAELDEDPWQLEQTVSSEEVDELRFSNVEDPDISGAVSLVRGTEDEATSIQIVLQDAGASSAEEERFEPGGTASIPKRFPTEVPLLEGATVVESGFLRQPRSEAFFLQFLTRESQDDVLEFYRAEFQEQGWTVEEAQAPGLAGGVRFADERGDIEGELLADRFADDRRYTLVRLQLQVNPAREQEQETPSREDEDENVPTTQPTRERTPAGNDGLGAS